jgi:hypothetical protein
MSLPKEDSEFQKAVGYINDNFFLATFEVKNNITLQGNEKQFVNIDNYKWDLNEKTNITIANGFKTPSWRAGIFRFHVDQDLTTNVAFFAAHGNNLIQITTEGIEQVYGKLSDITFKVGCYNSHCRLFNMVNCSEKSPCRIFVQGYKIYTN